MGTLHLDCGLLLITVMCPQLQHGQIDNRHYNGRNGTFVFSESRPIGLMNRSKQMSRWYLILIMGSMWYFIPPNLMQSYRKYNLICFELDFSSSRFSSVYCSRSHREKGKSRVQSKNSSRALESRKQTQCSVPLRGQSGQLGLCGVLFASPSIHPQSISRTILSRINYTPSRFFFPERRSLNGQIH